MQNKPRHAPNTMFWRSSVCHWDRVAPLTGDWIYYGQRNDGTKFHVVVTNPDAADRQRARLTR